MQLAKELGPKDPSYWYIGLHNDAAEVSLANASCESMDESLDRMEFLQARWIEARITAGSVITDDIRLKELAGFGDALNEFKLSLLQFAERLGMQLTGEKDVNAGQLYIRSPTELGLCEDVYMRRQKISL